MLLIVKTYLNAVSAVEDDVGKLVAAAEPANSFGHFGGLGSRPRQKLHGAHFQNVFWN
jgi:hypothetical protein